MADKKPGGTAVLDRPASRNDRRDPPPQEKTDNKKEIKAAQKLARARLQEALQKMDASQELQNEAMEVMREVEQSIGRHYSKAFVEKAIIGAQSYLSRKAQAEHDKEAKEKKYEEDKAKQEAEEKEKNKKEEEAKEHETPHGGHQVEEPDSAKKDEQDTTTEQAITQSSEATQLPSNPAPVAENGQQQTETPADIDSSGTASEITDPKQRLARDSGGTNSTNMTEQQLSAQRAHWDSVQKDADRRREQILAEHDERKALGKQKWEEEKKLRAKENNISQQNRNQKSSSTNPVGNKGKTSQTKPNGPTNAASHHVGGSVPVHAGGQRPPRGTSKNTGPGRVVPSATKKTETSKSGPTTRPSSASGRIRTGKIGPRKLPRYNNPNVTFSGGGSTSPIDEESITTHTTTSETTTDITVHEQQTERDTSITPIIGGFVGGFTGGAAAGSGGGESESNSTNEGDSGGIDGGAENGGRGGKRSKNAKANKEAGGGNGGGGLMGLVTKLTPQGRAAAVAKAAASGDAQEIVKQGRSVLFIVLIGFAALAFLIFVIIVLVTSILGGIDAQKKKDPANPLTLEKTGPPTATLGQELTYTITAKYAGSAQDITITDPLPVGTDYVSSNPPGVFDAAQRKVTWTASTLGIPLANPISMPVTLVLRSTQDNLNVVNKASATVTGGVPGGAGGAGGGRDVPPTKDNCGGKYNLTNPLGNFGDPTCDFKQEDLRNLIIANDAQHLHEWYDIIIPLESTFNPNAFNGNSASGKGAYGLYQMNPAGQGAGQFDNGSVHWSQQTINAIEYNKGLIQKGCDFRYWSTARGAGIAKGSC